MLNQKEILSTIEMIDQQHLDIRTITMGISLLSCCDPDARRACDKIYDKITRYAEKLVKTGEDIEREFGIPIVNKRISVTPMALVAGASDAEDYVPFALALDRAAQTCGVNFIGGYSALVQKGMTLADEKLIRSIPEALARTKLVCSSVNVGSTKAGINMDAVALMGRIIKETAKATEADDGLGCAKLVVFCNAVEDNPFMAGAFHGVGEAEKVINVGVSGPGVVYHALQSVKGQPFDVLAETIKKTAFRITRMGQIVGVEASRRLGVPFGMVVLDVIHGHRLDPPGMVHQDLPVDPEGLVEPVFIKAASLGHIGHGIHVGIMEAPGLAGTDLPEVSQGLVPPEQVLVRLLIQLCDPDPVLIRRSLLGHDIHGHLG